jgi:gliding motility-associated-like protein
MLKYLTLFILCQAPLQLYAQHQLNGDAIALGDDCFQLTPAQDGTQGSVWFFPTIDLRESFDLTAELHFGCADGNGADGIIFSLHTSSAGLGGGGQGQGFHYLWPSLGVEFDNFQNGDESDPSYDHLAIVSQGSVNHDAETNLAGPVQTDPNDGNVEDCEYHEIRISWDAFTQTMNIYYDCEWRLSYTGNIIGEIFQGDPMVFWGFTAACGASSNKQITCIKNLKIVEPLPDYTMCAGGQIQLEAEGGQSYAWSPTESLNNPYIANPLASPTENTTYQVTITDGCVQFSDSVHIKVVNDLEVLFGFSDSTLCDGETVYLDATTDNATYQWSTGATTPDITVSSSDYYVVTVTVEAGGETCVANDAAQVNFIKLPVILFAEYSSICEGETAVLDAGFPNATYLWQDGSTDSIYIIRESGTYSVEVAHACGNKKYTKEITFEQSCTDVYVPNAFSPNYDGVNDHFIILDGGDVVIIKHLRILDRWGEIVYEAKNFQPNDRAYGWDGTLKGQQVLSGVYVYFLEILFRDGSTKILVGEVSVIR